MQSNRAGPNNGQSGRPNLRIAHRRTPSELTPLMMEQYALQQQIEMLQAQQAMLQSQQANLAMGPPAGLGAGGGGFVFPPPPPQSGGPGMGGGHRRGISMSQSAAGPPPAPSSGASGFPESGHQRRSSQSGHNRRHSLALPEARRAAEKAQALKQAPTFAFPPGSNASTSNADDGVARSSSSGRASSPTRRNYSHGRSQSMATGGRGLSPVRNAGFQFPPAPRPTTGTANSSDVPSGRAAHARSSSRSIDTNWRAGAAPMAQEQNQNFFQPGHRARPSMGSSISSLQQFGQNFAFPGQPGGFMMPPMGNLMPNPLLQQQQNQNYGAGQGGANAQRKSLFSPYLPQANLPALMADGRLVAGVLRVNKKNRSDAYVSTDLLDDDIFICGSKDRNRALEGDYVAVELLDVDEVWSAKRDKEEKKKRKDTTTPAVGLRRQGSIRDRPEAKKKDDVEVEGQGLLLVDEEEVSDTQKPSYAGHIVAVIERTPGQMFSGTLGLLRPSSAATKEKQDAERREREGPNAPSRERQIDRPKIVWFKPTDKRVPLIAIPTEQAPRDFVENHESYKNRIFVACIKRWPITSLHPFGTLTEEIGNMGDVAVETEALLRDNSFLTESFPVSVVDAATQIKEEIDIEEEGRKDFRGEKCFAIVPDDEDEVSQIFHIRETDEGFEVGVHVVDINHFVRAGYALDREAKKRGSSVYLVRRKVPMLPVEFTSGVANLTPGKDRRAISIVFKISPKFELEDSWIGKSIVSSSDSVTESTVNAILAGTRKLEDADIGSGLQALHKVAKSFLGIRIPGADFAVSQLAMIAGLDQEPESPEVVSASVYTANLAPAIVQELLIRADVAVAELLFEKFPTTALLRKQSPPSAKRLDLFLTRARRLGVDFKTTDFADLMRGISNVEDQAVRKALEIYLSKACQTAVYIVADVNNGPDLRHYGLGLPVYAHFTHPFSRYADILTHRQLAAALSDAPWSEDLEAFGKSVDICNMKRYAARNAQAQSSHLILCSMIDKLSASTAGHVIRQAVVIGVAESSFDVLLPEFGVEKRVHLDQLPLHKAEFDAKTRRLELYWMKGVDSASYVPSEQSSGSPLAQSTSSLGAGSGSPIKSPLSASQQMRGASAKEEELLNQKMLEISSLTIEDESAAFEEGDSGLGASSGVGGLGVSGGAGGAAAASITGADVANLRRSCSIKFHDVDRRKDGSLVQTVTELCRIPVVLQADCLYKSPPLLLVRAINPSKSP